ncbi:hypothetical protein SPI_01027 [Niveomyces insectorum RCEF 264]|uniref:VTC domain-containing protein n=1 Tax=Niveomyces insectorum RCEF 264 TaxID=1081102 RepID=A0A167YLQ2_9HYPO|nr:hypothetical protein SPI_01027 [Niveomyces insectorum RCEF 264]
MNADKETQQEKRGFWNTLFRSRSSKPRTGKLEKARFWASSDKLRDGPPTSGPAKPSPSQPLPFQPRPAASQARPQGPVSVPGVVPARDHTHARSQKPGLERRQQKQPQPQQDHKQAAAPSLRAVRRPPVAGSRVVHEVVADTQTKPDRYPDAARPTAPDGAATSAAKGKTTTAPHDYWAHTPAPSGPLTEWPARGMPKDTDFSLREALDWIARGAPIHTGYQKPVPHMPEQYFMLFSSSHIDRTNSENGKAGHRGRRSRDRSGRRGERESDREESNGGNDSDDDTDMVDLHDSMTQFMTMRINEKKRSGSASAAPALHPWDTLEQPSFAFCFGRRPGTIALNHWIGLSNVLPPTIALRDSGSRPRDITLAQICQRLRDLQANGLGEDDPDRMYRSLYRRLLRDPDRVFSPHRTLDKQITDLIMVLSRPDYWIDFTQPRNQVVTRFIFDTSHANHQQYERFFHQLLLSLELDVRISSRQHDDWAKEKLLQQLPPTLQWNLALARRWRDYVRIDTVGKSADQIRLRLKVKARQIRMLRRFARMMKWPNLAATVANLKQRDADGSLESISSHAMAFFSGLVLPGPTFPFTIMNALIDVDPDRATDDLSMLTHLHPHCGFQYRNSYTYWTSTSIVGKVLAPTCRELAGWVGPARPTVDLGRSQIARIRSRRPRQHLTADDVRSMTERSDPLGPPAEAFPVSEYKLVATDVTDVVDYVRIELLSLRPALLPPSSATTTPGMPISGGSNSGLGWYDATVQFAIDGISWPMHLTYDVSFVCAWPCNNGPHPLFFDYVFSMVKADEIVHVHDWGPPSSPSTGTAGDGNRWSGGYPRSRTASPAVRFGGAGVPGPRYPSVSKDGDDEKVLVVEAFGVPDNEVLARAWCAHWGLSAVVADLRKTCMACAIREAYAATITVVILVDGQTTYGDD